MTKRQNVFLVLFWSMVAVGFVCLVVADAHPVALGLAAAGLMGGGLVGLALLDEVMPGIDSRGSLDSDSANNHAHAVALIESAAELGAKDRDLVKPLKAASPEHVIRVVRRVTDVTSGNAA